MSEAPPVCTPPLEAVPAVGEPQAKHFECPGCDAAGDLFVTATGIDCSKSCGYSALIASARLGAQQTLYALPPAKGAHDNNTPRDPLDAEVSECGTMNMFFVFSKADGSLEIATPPLDGTILPGVTRDSVIQLARQLPGVTVTERPVTVRELRHAALEGRLLEAFGTGTACSVQPVTEFKRSTPTGLEAFQTSRPVDDAKAISSRLRRQLEDIQTGKVKSPWSVPFD